MSSFEPSQTKPNQIPKSLRRENFIYDKFEVWRRPGLSLGHLVSYGGLFDRCKFFFEAVPITDNIMQSNTATTKLNWLKVETIATENSLCNSCHFRCTIWFFKKRSLSLCIRLRGLTEASSEALTFPGPDTTMICLWGRRMTGERMWPGPCVAYCDLLHCHVRESQERGQGSAENPETGKRQNPTCLLFCLLYF